MTKKAFLGTDVSKDTLDFALCLENQPEKYEYLRVTNDLAGFNRLLKWLGKLKVDRGSLSITLEHTGAYMIDFLFFLKESEMRYTVVPGLQILKSLGIQRGKNDKVDAKRIAYFAFLYRHKLRPSELPVRILAQIKELVTTRALLVKQRTAATNSLKTHQIRSKRIPNDLVNQVLTSQVKSLTEQILKLDREIKNKINQDPEVRKNYDLLISIKGIGPVIAAALIVFTNNFKSFSNAREFMSYTGIAPFEDESGKYKSKKRICKIANLKLKALLHTGVNSAITHDSQIKQYYIRKMESGKEKRQVKNAVAGKLISRAFAVINRGTPFVSVYEHQILKKKVA